MTQPIQRLAHLQTGTVDLHVEHVEGSPWNALLWIFFGRKRIEGLPLSVCVIEYRDALILIDAGISPRAVTDPEFWPDPVTRVIMNNFPLSYRARGYAREAAESRRLRTGRRRQGHHLASPLRSCRWHRGYPRSRAHYLQRSVGANARPSPGARGRAASRHRDPGREVAADRIRTNRR